ARRLPPLLLLVLCCTWFLDLVESPRQCHPANPPPPTHIYTLSLHDALPISSAPVLQTPKATSSTLYFDSLTVNAGNGGFLHCIQMDTSVNAANQVVSVGADIAFDADPKFFACLVRFESSSVPTTLPT